MPRTLAIAAVQLDANPAPLAERLGRAERLVADAAAAGARLVLLPELFNTGYCYDAATFGLAEPMSGPTVAWMRATAATYGIHLAGSLLLRERGAIYNALLLVAPDGQAWRYDKQYPWAWERATFRAGHGGAVAHTALGRIGMLICWDVAHPRLCRAYAGQVDLMLIASCPPDPTNSTYHFPDGATVTLDQLGPAFAPLKDSGRVVFGPLIDAQARWLGVPAVHTVGCGQLRLRVPNGRGTLGVLALAAPWMVRYLPQAHRLELHCAMVEGCRVLAADGRALASRNQASGEGSCIAVVDLADTPPQPRGRQPRSPLPLLAYLTSDWALPWLSIPAYRRGLRQTHELQLASVDRVPLRRLLLLGLGLCTVAVLARLLRRRVQRPIVAAGGSAVL